MNKLEYIPGDLVMYKGNICEVRSSDNGDKRHSQYCIIQVGKGIESLTFAHERELESIPLTSEILLKNGWKDDGTGYYYQLKDKLYLLVEYKDKKHKVIYSVEVYNNISPDSYDVGQDDFYLMTISYIHELQHLLFGLGLNSEMEV